MQPADEAADDVEAHEEASDAVQPADEAADDVEAHEEASDAVEVLVPRIFKDFLPPLVAALLPVATAGGKGSCQQLLEEAARRGRAGTKGREI